MTWKGFLNALKRCCTCCAKTADIVDKLTDIQAKEAKLIVKDSQGIQREISINNSVHIKIKGDVSIQNNNTVNNHVGIIRQADAVDESKVEDQVMCMGDSQPTTPAGSIEISEIA